MAKSSARARPLAARGKRRERRVPCPLLHAADRIAHEPRAPSKLGPFGERGVSREAAIKGCLRGPVVHSACEFDLTFSEERDDVPVLQLRPRNAPGEIHRHVFFAERIVDLRCHRERKSLGERIESSQERRHPIEAQLGLRDERSRELPATEGVLRRPVRREFAKERRLTLLRLRGREDSEAFEVKLSRVELPK